MAALKCVHKSPCIFQIAESNFKQTRRNVLRDLYVSNARYFRCRFDFQKNNAENGPLSIEPVFLRLGHNWRHWCLFFIQKIF